MELGRKKYVPILTEQLGATGRSARAKALENLLDLNRLTEPRLREGVLDQWRGALGAQTKKERRRTLHFLVLGALAAKPGEPERARWEAFWEMFLWSGLAPQVLAQCLQACVQECCSATDAHGSPAPRLPFGLLLSNLESAVIRLMTATPGKAAPFKRYVELVDALKGKSSAKAQDIAWRCIGSLPATAQSRAWAAWLGLPARDQRLREVKELLCTVDPAAQLQNMDPLPLMSFIDKPIDTPQGGELLRTLLSCDVLKRDVAMRLLFGTRPLSEMPRAILLPAIPCLLVKAFDAPHEKRRCVERLIDYADKARMPLKHRRALSTRGRETPQKIGMVSQRTSLLIEIAEGMADEHAPCLDLALWQWLVTLIQRGWNDDRVSEAIQIALCTLVSLCSRSEIVARATRPLWRKPSLLKIGSRLEKAIAVHAAKAGPIVDGVPPAVWQQLAAGAPITAEEGRAVIEVLFAAPGVAPAAAEHVAIVLNGAATATAARAYEHPLYQLPTTVFATLTARREDAPALSLHPALWKTAMTEPAVFDLLWTEPSLLVEAAVQAYAADPHSVLPPGVALLSTQRLAVRVCHLLMEGAARDRQLSATLLPTLLNHPSKLCSAWMFAGFDGRISSAPPKYHEPGWTLDVLRRCARYAVACDTDHGKCLAGLIEALLADVDITKLTLLSTRIDRMRERAKRLDWLALDGPAGKSDIACALDCRVRTLETLLTRWVHAWQGALVALDARVRQKRPVPQSLADPESDATKTLCALLIALGHCDATRSREIVKNSAGQHFEAMLRVAFPGGYGMPVAIDLRLLQRLFTVLASENRCEYVSSFGDGLHMLQLELGGLSDGEPTFAELEAAQAQLDEWVSSPESVAQCQLYGEFDCTVVPPKSLDKLLRAALAHSSIPSAQWACARLVDAVIGGQVLVEISSTVGGPPLVIGFLTPCYCTELDAFVLVLRRVWFSERLDAVALERDLVSEAKSDPVEISLMEGLWERVNSVARDSGVSTLLFAPLRLPSGAAWKPTRIAPDALPKAYLLDPVSVWTDALGLGSLDSYRGKRFYQVTLAENVPAKH